MSYISAIMSPNYKDVIVWERGSDGVRQVKEYPAPFYFYVEDEDGEHKDIHGNRLKKLEFAYSKIFRETRDKFKNAGAKVYESDISPEYKILSEHYYKSELPNTHVTYFDIEVDYDKRRGFSSTEDPYAPISAISIHHYWSNETFVLAVPPNKSMYDPVKSDITVDTIDQSLRELGTIELFGTERELLLRFYELIEDSDILSGWNSAGFDIPYIYERSLKVLGERSQNFLCFPNSKSPRYREIERGPGMTVKVLDIFGRESIDYLEIYKKFEVSTKPSFSLDAISEEVLPEMKKLEYDGSLYDLYRNDFNHFLRYNLRDSEVLKGFEDKLGYMQLAIHLAHDSTGLVGNVLGTIKLAELAIINCCHYDHGTVVPDTNYSADSGMFGGALVLPPIVGMHDYVSAIDLVSLYPSAMRSINISPETVIGQFFENQNAHVAVSSDSTEELFFKYETGEVESNSAAEWKIKFQKNKWAVSGYGTVFDQNRVGFIPSILSTWFNSRKDYKKKKSEAQKRMDASTTEGERLKYRQIRDYCDRVQYILKIKLNSLYGVLGNRFFKFYDVRLAESTTKTGQQVLMHMVRTVAQTLDGEYTWPSESTIYSDTDSCYFKTHMDNIADAIKVSNLMFRTVNNSFPPFMSSSFLCNPGYDNLMVAELDGIAARGIFCKKKMYALHIVHKEGRDVDEMKVMGLQIKKTTIPKQVQVKLTKFVKSLLTGEDWDVLGEAMVEYKETLKASDDILKIGLPKGIKGVEDYTNRHSMKEVGLRLPGHVAAAMLWNSCIDAYKDVESFKITSGMKIKVFYLTHKIGIFKSIAVPTDLTKLPSWFIDHFSDIIARDMQVERLVDKPLKSVLDAIGRKIPTRKTLLFDSLVEY